MDVHIQEVVGTVRAVSDDSLLSPQLLERIVAAVLSCVDERQLRERRAKADTDVSSGVAAEQERQP